MDSARQLMHLFQFHHIRTASFDNRNADKTGFIRFLRFFLFLMISNLELSFLEGYGLMKRISQDGNRNQLQMMGNFLKDYHATNSAFVLQQMAKNACCVFAELANQLQTKQ